MLSSICVFAGSSLGEGEKYADAARALAGELVRRRCHLVYGGAHTGLMGVLADTVLAAGGHVTGVIPEHLVEREVAHRGLSQLIVVRSMHERKETMARHADGFVALPGGFGTLEELFEVVTWAQLGLHEKPCGLLNVGGYYDSLLQFLDTSVAAGFVKNVFRAIVLEESEPRALLDRFDHYHPPDLEPVTAEERFGHLASGRIGRADKENPDAHPTPFG